MRVAVDGLSRVGAGEHSIGRPVFVAGAGVLLTEVRRSFVATARLWGYLGERPVDTELLNGRLRTENSKLN